MPRSEIKFSRVGAVATVTIDRPQKFNAITREMVREMIQLFEALALDATVRAVVLTGSGKHFSAGGDMGYIGTMVDPDPAKRSAALRTAIMEDSLPFAQALSAIPQPVVASVRGHAIGIGLQMVILSDLVVASDTAQFTLPMLDLGHTPDHGETWSLPRKIGTSRALQMTLLPDRVPAAEAERYGLVNWLVADADLEQRTMEIVQRLASGPPLATRSAKQLYRSSESSTLEEAILREADASSIVGAQEDFVEAINAFSEHRRPTFHGR